MTGPAHTCPLLWSESLPSSRLMLSSVLDKTTRNNSGQCLRSRDVQNTGDPGGTRSRQEDLAGFGYCQGVRCRFLLGCHLKETFGSKATCGQCWLEAAGVTGQPCAKLNGSRCRRWLLTTPGNSRHPEGWGCHVKACLPGTALRRAAPSRRLSGSGGTPCHTPVLLSGECPTPPSSQDQPLA